MKDNMIKEFFEKKSDARGHIFELITYPIIKKYFGEVEESEPMDYKVVSKNIHVEVKYNTAKLSWYQIDFIIENPENEYYIVTNNPRIHEGETIVEEKTVLGTVYIIKLDKGKIISKYKKINELMNRMAEELLKRGFK